MENLTKENFFNEMKQKYPKAMDHFCVWIDQYKIRIGWANIFHGHMFQTPKYHDLPIAWQIGIFFQYMMECFHRDDLRQENFLESAKESLQEEFERIETKLTKP